MSPHKEETLLQVHWNRYLSNREDIEARDFILLSYQPLVEKIASKLMRKRPPNVEHKDLVQAGMIGLQHALERYDPSQGALFSTFAAQRVRGAILDEINSLDWTPRLVRERIKSVIRATEEHYKTHQHKPTPEEITQIIARTSNKTLTVEQVEEAIQQSSKTYVHAVDNATAVQHEENSRFEGIGSPGASQNSEVELHVVHTKFYEETVREAVKDVCTHEERLIIEGIFFHDKAMKTLAAEMSVPVSRVSNHKKNAIAKIEQYLRERGVTYIEF